MTTSTATRADTSTTTHRGGAGSRVLLGAIFGIPTVIALIS